VTDQKSPLEQALDLVVYTPVGLAITARELLPRLAEKGRERVTSQVALARTIGQLAVAQGQREATKVVNQATEALVGLGVIPGDRHGSGHFGTASDPAGDWSQPAGNGRVSDDLTSAAQSSAGLAIPGYDSLSASQVVQRLAGLNAEELEAVRLYESATRGRRTILSKIAQLQASES
jgi:hypothetical protein